MTGKTLVTGGSGFTGGHLVRRLVVDGEAVVALVRPSSRTTALEELGVECRIVDLVDPEAIAAQLDGIERVYHLAAAFRSEHPDVDYFRRVNAEATRALLQAALRTGVTRFVHCSTVGVQGDIEDPPATEDYRFAPGDHYQETKMEGELAAREFMGRGLNVSMVRPAGIYGPGDRRFLKLFRTVARRTFRMIGSGDTLYHMTYVDDLVNGILLAGQVPGAVGEVFTIAGPQYTTLRELVDHLADALGVPHPRGRIPYAPVHALAVACEKVSRGLGVSAPIYPRRVEFFAKDRAFDISKARRLLGYEPEVDLPEGLARTAAWYRANGLL